VVVLMPQKTPIHSRCWYRFWTEWPDASKGGVQWADVTAVPAFDFAMTTDRTLVGPRDLVVLSTNVTSHFSGPVAADLRMEGRAALHAPLQVSAYLVPGVSKPVLWKFHAPPMPGVAEAKFTANAAAQTAEWTRYLRTGPAEWVVADLTQTPFTRGLCVRGKPESAYDHLSTGAFIDVVDAVSGGESLKGFQMHPPYKSGVGYSFATFEVNLPKGEARLEFAIGFLTGSTTQDGCVFKVAVLDQGAATEVFSEQYATRETWAWRSADLSAFAGKTVTLKLIADVGPNDNSYSDWAAWGAPRVVMAQPATLVEVFAERPPEKSAPPPEPLAGLTHADLAKIVKATLTLESAGVNGGQYTSYVYLNGIKVGSTPISTSDTEWGPGELPLPKEALAAIRPLNTLSIRNPGQDSMKVRSLCLRFELEDGRRGSSNIDLGPYCSDAGWKFAEGAGVPAGQDLPPITLAISIS
jgi:hypothetical protein